MIIKKSIRCSAIPYEFKMSQQLRGVIESAMQAAIENYEYEIKYGDINEGHLINIIVDDVEMLLDDYCDNSDYDVMTDDERELFKKGRRRFLATCKRYVLENLSSWFRVYAL